MKFLVVWWYNYNKKYHMVLVNSSLKIRQA